MAKKDNKKEEQVVERKERAQVYHVKRRASDGKWEVKLSKGEVAIKLFNTQKEAIEEAKRLSESTGRGMVVHGLKGQVRKKNTY
ncbi:MAG TPA: DUF2188 domain-containing protein [Bacilli bacterium]|jgi:hypothetical protein|nr:DUF2188 domain-containing protein [Bacilli bacterium]HPK86043.1 DUF2188 domain-containing protein [Bacilli bacterium]